MDETFFEWVDGLYEQGFDDATTEAMVYMRNIPGVILDRAALREVIAEAHTVDDPDWRFNVNNLVTELIRLASPPDTDWSDREAQYDEIYQNLESLFPVTI